MKTESRKKNIIKRNQKPKYEIIDIDRFDPLNISNQGNKPNFQHFADILVHFRFKADYAIINISKGCVPSYEGIYSIHLNNDFKQ